MYWRCDDIPELHSVPKVQRSRMWSEAVTRSFSVRYLLARLATTMIVVVTFAGVGYLLWPTQQTWLLSGLLGIPLTGIVCDFTVTQPRARRWLREHAGELAHYLST